jgi:hypothetical protein
MQDNGYWRGSGASVRLVGAKAWRGAGCSRARRARDHLAASDAELEPRSRWLDERASRGENMRGARLSRARRARDHLVAGDAVLESCSRWLDEPAILGDAVCRLNEFLFPSAEGAPTY